jgi:hypothetical protein
MSEGRNDITAQEIRLRLERLEALTLELGALLARALPAAHQWAIKDVFDKYRTEEPDAAQVRKDA